MQRLRRTEGAARPRPYRTRRRKACFFSGARLLSALQHAEALPSLEHRLSDEHGRCAHARGAAGGARLYAVPEAGTRRRARAQHVRHPPAGRGQDHLHASSSAALQGKAAGDDARGDGLHGGQARAAAVAGAVSFRGSFPAAVGAGSVARSAPAPRTRCRCGRARAGAHGRGRVAGIARVGARARDHRARAGGVRLLARVLVLRHPLAPRRGAQPPARGDSFRGTPARRRRRARTDAARPDRGPLRPRPRQRL